MPVDASLTIQFEGLADFRRDLKAIDPALVKELGREYKTIGDMLRSEASDRALALGGVAAKAAPAVTSTARTQDVALRLRSAVAGEEFALGAEFGGGSRPTTRQFQPWRGRGADAGYFLYPAIRDNSAQIIEQFEQVIARATARAFPK